MNMPTGMKPDPKATTRKGSDDVWPLRGADGRPFYERKKDEQARKMAPSEAN